MGTILQLDATLESCVHLSSCDGPPSFSRMYPVNGRTRGRRKGGNMQSPLICPPPCTDHGLPTVVVAPFCSAKTPMSPPRPPRPCNKNLLRGNATRQANNQPHTLRDDEKRRPWVFPPTVVLTNPGIETPTNRLSSNYCVKPSHAVLAVRPPVHLDSVPWERSTALARQSRWPWTATRPSSGTLASGE